jgi:hypothetical protein
VTAPAEPLLTEMPVGYWTDAAGAWCTLPWPSDPAARQEIAEWSLGPLVIQWAEGRLPPAQFERFGPGLIHPLTGLPWRFTRGQKRFLLMWYWYNEWGRYRYRSGVKRGSKGTGKDYIAAAHGNIELVGPSQLIRDPDTGRWVGMPHRMPLVQVASNSEAQSKDTLRIANAMWSRHARGWHDLDCGETRTILKGRGRFEVVTSSEASSEGDPATMIILNESQHMTGPSGGHRVTEVARRNVGKSPHDIQARLVEYTNAHQMGGDSTAERSYEAWQKQASGRYPNLKRDILYDSVEADPNLSIFDPGQLRLALRQAYSDAGWADLERLVDEVHDPRTSTAEAIRYYLNGLAVREDAWIDPRCWDTLARPDTVIVDRTPIAMFLDCSKSSDATGLVACRISDGHVLTLGVWQSPRGARGETWLVPRAEVDAVVRAAFQRYRVMWFGVDPSPALDDETEALYWADLIDSWHQAYHRKLPMWATPGAVGGNAVKFDMRLSQRGAADRLRAFTEMAELCASWIDEAQTLTHDGDPALRVHVHNARRRANQWGTSLGKETRDSRKLVDLAVCMVGAQLGRRRILNSSKVRTPGRGGRTREAMVL